MFKTSLAGILEKVFAVKKVSFALPIEANEQGVLFVKVDTCKPSSCNNKMGCRVTGKITMFATSEAMPFGYLSKKISNSGLDAKDIFFYNIEEDDNFGGAPNLIERGCEFVYFYKEDYDPSRGEITSINFEGGIE